MAGPVWHMAHLSVAHGGKDPTCQCWVLFTHHVSVCGPSAEQIRRLTSRDDVAH
jgi:hypothetical protein